MHPRLNQAILGAFLLTILACTKGGDSEAPTLVTGPGYMPSTTTPVFDPANGAVPLPNVLVTGTVTSVSYTATPTPAPGTLNIAPGVPLTPDKALAYVNLKEMGSTHAVSGLNAPIYIGFNAAVDTSTVTAANIKVFQVVPDVPTNPSSTENNPLGFVDVSGLFTYSTMTLTPSGMGVYAMPKLPLIPGTRYLYVVTNRVKDTAGLPVSASPYFEALKSVTPLTGSFAALEPVRANVLVTGGTSIQLSGYAKVMDDLIAAAATTTVTSRADITLMGRFITTGAGYIPADPIGTPASRMPLETALWAYANNANLSATPMKADFSTAESRVWTNGVANFQLMGTSAIPSGAGSISAIFGTIPSTAVGYVGAGTFQSADFQLDPYTVHGNPSISGNLDGVTGAYLPGTSTVPGTGVLQASRNATGVLRGFYHQTRQVPFIVIAPISPAPAGGYPVAIFMHGIGGQKEHVLGLANTLCAAGYAVIAIDQALHGLPSGVAGSLTAPGYTGPGMGNGRPAAEWASNFFMLPSSLTARTNFQTSAFNLWRLERILKQPALDPTSLQAAMTTAGKPVVATGASQFVGQSLGSITGAYFLAGNSSQTGGSNMKGLFSVPGARLAYVLRSPAFSSTVDAGLAAAGVPTGSGAYYQFFALAQAVVDPVDPASMGLPISSTAPSRFAGRLLVQEAVGDLVIPNTLNGQYFVNAFAGRQGQLGADVSGGFTAVLRNGQTAPYVPYVFGTTLATFKTPLAAATVSTATTPTQGVMQYSPAEHGMLLKDAATPANVAACQAQMYAWVKYGLVVDGANAAGFPIAPPTSLETMEIPGLFGPESLAIHFPTASQQ